MKILISGGSGLIGKILVPHLVDQGHVVTILTRRPVINKELSQGYQLVHYDPRKSGVWQDTAAESDVIINLAGASIFRLWTPLAKREIVDSRVVTTRKLVEAISFRKNQNKTLISVSGAGIYGPRGDECLIEQDEPGTDFLAQVARQWESVALSASQFGMRVVLFRLGNVLSLKGGMFTKLVKLAKYRLACAMGDGQQWISWIHEEDLARAVLFVLECDHVTGPVNATAPSPVRNADFMLEISKHARNNPVLTHVPRAILKLAAGEFSSALLTGQRVIPQKLLDSGFSFKYPTIDDALGDLMK